MAIDTLKRLSGPAALTTVAVTQYTAPLLTTATIRSIHVCNETSADHTFTLSIGVDGAGKRLFKSQPVAANDSFDWSGMIVLGAGELLQALADANTALTLTVSGVETV
jgi:hypothetical protein